MPPAASEGRRAPGLGAKVLASLLSGLAIAALLYGLVGLLAADSVLGFLVAGVLFIGGGLALARRAWRLYRGTPSTWEPLPPDATREQSRAFSRDLARRQWTVLARLLAALTPVYLLLALALEGAEPAVGAAAVTALMAAVFGLMAWSLGRRPS